MLKEDELIAKSTQLIMEWRDKNSPGFHFPNTAPGQHCQFRCSGERWQSGEVNSIEKQKLENFLPEKVNPGGF